MQMVPEQMSPASIETKRRSALELNLDLSRRIEEGRRDRRLTKKEVAQHLGLSVNGLNKKLSGESQWKLSEAVIIADWWRVPLGNFLLRGDSAPLEVAEKSRPV